MQNRTIFHIDFNSYFATIEQQANPRLRGKPVGVTGGDRSERTVVTAASVEAKKLGVRTGMSLGEARKVCPHLVLVTGDSDKYLECTKRFLNILKYYSPYLEVFSIDECFLELPTNKTGWLLEKVVAIAEDIKDQVRKKIGGWVSCSIGISYNKLMAKLAGSLYKPDGLVVIADEEAARFILDRVELDDICGIGHRIKRRLNNMGVFDFKTLRSVPLKSLLLQFKSYGQSLYNMSRGIDEAPIVPFYEREEVKSVGHRMTLRHDTSSPEEIKRVLLKLSELVARRLRAKGLEGRTVTIWYRAAFSPQFYEETGHKFYGDGMQTTTFYTNDGLEIFNAGWRCFLNSWYRGAIRMVGVSVSNLRKTLPGNLSFLEEIKRKEVITKALDKINDKYGEFTLQRGVLLGAVKVKRMPNPFLSDRRFKI